MDRPRRNVLRQAVGSLRRAGAALERRACEDVRFWLPAWRSESEQTQDPATELSLMHLGGIAALKERVWRVRSGLSRASAALHRTAHVMGSVLVEAGPSDDTCQVLSAGAVHVYDPAAHTEHCFFSRYEHTLRLAPQGWKIAAKRISLMNDRIPTMLDFYSV